MLPGLGWERGLVKMEYGIECWLCCCQELWAYSETWEGLVALHQCASPSSFELPPSDWGKTCLKYRNLSSIWRCFPEFHFQLVLCGCMNMREVSSEVPSGSRTPWDHLGFPWLPLTSEDTSKVKLQAYLKLLREWRALLRAHSRCFSHAFYSLIFITNLSSLLSTGDRRSFEV